MQFDLQSTDAIINELGGNQAVADLTGIENAKAVSNWRGSNCFPAWTYLTLTNALQARGKTAPEKLWKMEPPAKRRESRS